MNKEKNQFFEFKLKTIEVTHWEKSETEDVDKYPASHGLTVEEVEALQTSTSGNPWNFERGFPGRRAGYWHGGHLDIVYIPHINQCLLLTITKTPHVHCRKTKDTDQY